jgi:alpha-glucosidase/alpha-D-xyloside xylohydrolase
MGGQEITRYVNLGTMPIYIRAGAIIPGDPPRQYTDEPSDRPTTLTVYTGDDGDFVLYDDDGIRLEDAHATWTHLAWDDQARRLTIEPRAGSKPSEKPRQFDVLLLPRNSRKTATFKGERVEVKFD